MINIDKQEKKMRKKGVQFFFPRKYGGSSRFRRKLRKFPVYLGTNHRRITTFFDRTAGTTTACSLIKVKGIRGPVEYISSEITSAAFSLRFAFVSVLSGVVLQVAASSCECLRTMTGPTEAALKHVDIHFSDLTYRISKLLPTRARNLILFAIKIYALIFICLDLSLRENIILVNM